MGEIWELPSDGNPDMDETCRPCPCSVEDASPSVPLGAGGSESSEQTRWWFEDQWWVKSGEHRCGDPGEVVLGDNGRIIRKKDCGLVPFDILRPARSFKCSDGVERWETGEVAQLTVERKGTWFLDTDGYPVKCETPTIFEHPILEPLPEATGMAEGEARPNPPEVSAVLSSEGEVEARFKIENVEWPEIEWVEDDARRTPERTTGPQKAYIAQSFRASDGYLSTDMTQGCEVITAAAYEALYAAFRSVSSGKGEG